MSPSDEVSAASAPRHWVVDDMRPHEPAVRSYLRSQFPSVDHDDVVQESYLKLLKSQASGRIASTKAYFITVARNTALTIFRRSKIFSDVAVNELPDWRVVADGPDAAECADAQQRLELAVEAIDQLPGRCREIFKLAALEQLSPAEIAFRLGLAEATIHVQLGRGVKKCADYLRKRGERE